MPAPTSPCAHWWSTHSSACHRASRKKSILVENADDDDDDNDDDDDDVDDDNDDDDGDVDEIQSSSQKQKSQSGPWGFLLLCIQCYFVLTGFVISFRSCNLQLTSSCSTCSMSPRMTRGCCKGLLSLPLVINKKQNKKQNLKKKGFKNTK
jgi:hypothetical protein